VSGERAGSRKSLLADSSLSLYPWDMIQPISELEKLPLHERLQLVEDLWDSIALDTDDLVVPQWQKDELDRRDIDFAANPGSGIPWETARDLIRGHHG
jgi:putative addiction module component (TIGR02574 family)